MDTKKYLSLIEERNKEIEREKEKHGRRFGQPKEKSQFADVKTEIRINKEYFRNAGIELDEAEEPQTKEADADQPAASGKTEDADAQKMDLPELELSSEKEAEIDLSNVEWDVDGLNEAEPEKESAEE